MFHLVNTEECALKLRQVSACCTCGRLPMKWHSSVYTDTYVCIYTHVHVYELSVVSWAESRDCTWGVANYLSAGSSSSGRPINQAGLFWCGCWAGLHVGRRLWATTKLMGFRMCWLRALQTTRNYLACQRYTFPPTTLLTYYGRRGMVDVRTAFKNHPQYS